MDLLVICCRPGTIRAGRRHPFQARCAPEAFAPEQWREMLADPAFVVVAGEPLSAEEIDALRTPAPAPYPVEPAPKAPAHNPARQRAGRKGA